MKTRQRIAPHWPYCLLKTAAIALCALASGCGPQQTTTEPSADSSTNPMMQDGFGWLHRVPQDAGFFFSVYDGSGMVRNLAHSNYAKALYGNPQFQKSVQEELGTDPPPFEQYFDRILERHAEAADALQIADRLAGSEFFVYLPQEAIEPLRMWQALLVLVRRAQIESALELMTTPAPSEPASEEQLQALQQMRILASIEPMLSKIELPAFAVGFRAPTLRDIILEQWEEMKAQAPSEVEISEWTAPGLAEPMVRISVKIGELMQQAELAELRQALESIGAALEDPDFAGRMTKNFTERVEHLAWGYQGDVLLVLAGSDLSAFQFVPEGKAHESLASGDAFKPLQPLIDSTGKVGAVSYASKPLLEILNPPLGLSELFDSLAPVAGQLLSEESLEQVRAALVKSDDLSARFMPQVESAAASVLLRGDNWTFESFGGVSPAFRPSTGSAKLRAAAFPNAALYIGGLADPAATSALFDAVARIASVSMAVFEKDVLPQIPDAEARQFRQVSAIFQPKLVKAYELIRQLNTTTLGVEGAFVMDLSGTIPALPMLPEPLHGFDSFPRMGFFWPDAQTADFAAWWSSTIDLVNDLAAFAPPESGWPFPLPEPVLQKRDAGTFAFLPIPLPPEFDAPAGFVGSNQLGLGTSVALLESMSATATTAVDMPEDSQGAIAEFHLRADPMVGAMKNLFSLMQKHPELFFQGDRQREEEFIAGSGAALELIESQRALGAISHIVRRDGGKWRRTTVLGPQ